MNIIQLREKIDEKNKSSLEVRRQLNQINQELSQLRSQFDQLEMEEFVNYLQIEEIIEIDGYYTFKGYCRDPKYTSTLQSGEKIKILKKNRRSIVIEVIKKLKRQWDDNQKKSIVIGDYNPAWNIRVDLDSFFHFYMKSKTRKESFDSYIKRKHLLDSLFDER
jgi:nucleoid DNA-binding protein